MPKPDFSKVTIETLAKRAGYLCSNPECRVRTVGPNTDIEKAISIGEAAHIQGARPNSARFSGSMSDETRAAITNGIWLCGNCHTMVDRDERQFPAELLFAWREIHDQFVAEQLGTPTDRVRFELANTELEPFSDYPAIIKRIVLDKPPGWEWRLTAELFRHLNAHEFRRLRDLKDGLYTKPMEAVPDEELLSWVSARMHESTSLIAPLSRLLDRMTKSWGPLGQPGDAHEILHISKLMNRALAQVVDYEERIAFARLPDELLALHKLMHDTLGSQIEKFQQIPIQLDYVVSLLDTDNEGTAERPRTITFTIDFELPKGWERKMAKEIKKAERYVRSQLF